MRALTLLLVLSSLLAACGDDDPLTSAEREWCSLTNASEASALKFDVIFEAGVGLDLAMDEINARAGVLNEQYVAEGMSDDEAVRAVSDDLLATEDYIAACRAAFESCRDFLASAAADDEVCP